MFKLKYLINEFEYVDTKSARYYIHFDNHPFETNFIHYTSYKCLNDQFIEYSFQLTIRTQDLIPHCPLFQVTKMASLKYPQSDFN